MLIPHRSNLKKMRMFFELSKENDFITFNTIRVRRSAQYPSANGKTLLNIIEVHDLYFDKHDMRNLYSVYTPETIANREHQPMWYEISLSSTVANKAFQENVNLEFGEESEWTEQALLDQEKFLQDLYLPANCMVKKMDGMGFYNDNGHVPPVIEHAAQSVASTPTPLRPTDAGYW